MMPNRSSGASVPASVPAFERARAKQEQALGVSTQPPRRGSARRSDSEPERETHANGVDERDLEPGEQREVRAEEDERAVARELARAVVEALQGCGGGGERAV